MTDSTDSGSSASEQTPVAGFWRRVGAFVLDCIILAIPAYIIGFIFYDWAASIGQWGRATGFVVALLYFGVFDSRLGRGQSLGKRALGILVTDRSGRLLSPTRSAARFLIFAVPYFLNGVFFNAAATQADLPIKLLGLLLAFVVFGGLGAAAYLFVFNRRTRQSLHDLAVGSFVICRGTSIVGIALATPPFHVAMAGGWFLLVLIGSAASFVLSTPAVGVLRPLNDLRSTIRTELPLIQVGVGVGATRITMSGQAPVTTTYLTVNVLAYPRQDKKEVELSVAHLVLERSPDLLGKTILIVVVDQGFDLGIAAWNSRHRIAGTASEWKQRIEQARLPSKKT